MTKLPSEEEDQQVDKQSTADDHNNISTDNSTAGATKTTASSGSHKNSVTTTAIVNSTRSNGYEQQPGERHYKDPASQIYVTSVPSLASPAGKRSSRRESKRQQRQSNDRGVSSSDEARHDSDPDPYKSGDELELTQDLSRDEDEEGRRRARGSARSCEPVDDHQGLPSGDRSEDELDRSTSQKNEVDGGCLSESGDSLPGTPEKTYGLVSDSRSAGRGTGGKKKREVLLDPPSLDTSNSLRGTKLPLTATSSGASSSSRKSGSSGGTEERRRSQVAVGLCQVQPSTEAVLDDNSMISMVEFNPATREMAVDVPESFIGRTKTPPRYPPPKHAVSPHNNNIYTNSKKRGSGGESSGSATPLNGTLSYPGELNQAPVLVQTPNSQEEQNRIKKYEDEIRLRREREEEELMLRSSLRSSQKLQSLASQLPPAPVHGVDNRAFVQQEDTTTTVNNITPHTLNSNVASPTGFNELIQSLQRIENVLQNGHRINEDVALVAQLFSNPDFQKVFAVHNKVQQTCCVNRPPTPVEHGAQELVNQVLHVVQSSSSPDASELVDILNKHSMEGLIFAHDHVANRQPVKAPERVMPGEVTLDQPQLPSNYQNDMVKIVRIDKTNDPLGATIRNEDGAVIIGRIVKGGAAEKSGQLHEGDEILEVNGVEVRSKDVNDVCMMLTGMTGTLTFIIAPRSAAPQEPPMPILAHADMVVVKALFDYDHEADPYLPCRELGISFEKGDILRVISQEDENWWQAFKEGDNNQSLAGLIPSKKFQEQREASKPTVVGDTNNKEKAKKSKQLLCAKKPQKKKKKKMLYSNYNDVYKSKVLYRTSSMMPMDGTGSNTECCVMKAATLQGAEGQPAPSTASTAQGIQSRLSNIFCFCCLSSSNQQTIEFSDSDSDEEDFDNEEILSYEEVELYYPKVNYKRPVVLIGPPNIGRHELRQKLMEDSDRFAAAIPHTSRPRRDKEVEGVDYHFITKAEFERDILNRKFVEHGEYEKAFYGTSFESIRDVVRKDKICVLNLHPLCLKKLKNSDLMPFVVFVAAPSIEVLRQRNRDLGENYKDEELKDIIERAREMEDQYSHYFDIVITVRDVDQAYHTLLGHINMLEREPQWVPASWIANRQQQQQHNNQ